MRITAFGFVLPESGLVSQLKLAPEPVAEAVALLTRQPFFSCTPAKAVASVVVLHLTGPVSVKLTDADPTLAAFGLSMGSAAQLLDAI